MLLKIENLRVRFGNATVLDIRTPICIEEGDRIGIIGSNGAGKSTFIKSILGLVPIWLLNILWRQCCRQKFLKIRSCRI